MATPDVMTTGLFCHFRWCWGLIPVFAVYTIGTIFSLMGFIIAFIYTLCLMMS